MSTKSEITSKVQLAQQVKELERQAARNARLAVKLADQEQATKARNPQYVVGSRRPATESEQVALKKTVVCEIVCQDCGETVVVSSQDGFQVKCCKACKQASKKEDQKIKRAAKKVAGQSVEDLERQIKALKALIASRAAA